MITLSIDPGKHHAGWAIFVGEGNAAALVRAGIVRLRLTRNEHGPYYRQGKHKQPQCQSSVTIAESIGSHVEVARRFFDGKLPGPCNVEVIGELPHVYLDENRKLRNNVDPEDLFYLTLTVGAIAGEIRQPKRVRLVEPSEWKMQRGDLATWKMIRDTLNPPEIEVAIACGVYDDREAKTFHHGLEAVGIGLWSLFRL